MVAAWSAIPCHAKAFGDSSFHIPFQAIVTAPSARSYHPKYSLTDYLQWQGDWELWDGVAIAMSPSPLGVHQRVLFRLASVLSIQIAAAACDATVLGELDWIVDDTTIVRPDLIVVCGPPPDKYLNEPPSFIAEIQSPSTGQNDVTYKLHLYERQRVPTYLVVDPGAATFRWFLLVDDKYQEQPTATEAVLQVCPDCFIRLDVASAAFDR